MTLLNTISQSCHILFMRGKENKFSFLCISGRNLKTRACHTVPHKSMKQHLRESPFLACTGQGLQGEKQISGWKIRNRKRTLCILLLHNTLCMGLVDIIRGSKGWGAQKHRKNWIMDDFYDYKVIFFGTHTWLSAAIPSRQNLKSGCQKRGPRESVSAWISIS